MLNLLPRASALVAPLALGALLAATPAPASATPLYPDLRTLPPRELHLSQTNVGEDGGPPYDHVLRFSNTVWNAGRGTLTVHGTIKGGTGTAYQRVDDTDGTATEHAVGTFYYHPVHHHYHFEDWGAYELWTKANYDSWRAGGSATAHSTQSVGTKTTSCVLDEEFVVNLLDTPAWGRFPFAGCSPDAGDHLLEGLSPGWGDTYDYSRFDQWIDLGQNALADGDYVLRSVSDPKDKILESPEHSDRARESQSDNEAVTPFTIKGGALVDTLPPTGSIRINQADRQTAIPQVEVAVTGRDDVSGVDAFRVSNDGQAGHWATFEYGQAFGERTLGWNLGDARYGGNQEGGVKRVHVQFRDRKGHWGREALASIQLSTCASSRGATSRYASAVAADRPRAQWRLDDTCGTKAVDARGGHPGRYVGSPRLGAHGLLGGEAGDTAVSFDGRSQYVSVLPAPQLDLGARLTLEAWIRPRALPRRGHFASIVSKAESYSLQFDGDRLELAIIQRGARRRLLARAHSIRVGRTYHVAGTYDGHVQRLFVNGRLVASRRQTGGATATSSPLQLAAWNGASEPFEGTLDEAAVYPAALAGSRIAAHFRAGSPPPAVVAPSNLRARVLARTRVALTWADDASHERRLELQRSTGPRFRRSRTLLVRAYATGYLDRGLRRGTRYWYRVRAVTATHHSAWSRAARAATRR